MTAPADVRAPRPAAVAPAPRPGRPPGRRAVRVARFAVLGGALAAAVVVGIGVGSVRIPPAEVVAILLGHEGTQPAHALIVHDVRLPRTITAVLAGAALAVAGVQTQTLFRNPLAEPYVLGVSSGASLGVAAVVLLGRGSGDTLVAGLGWLGNLGVVAAAAAGAAVLLVVVLAVSYRLPGAATVLVVGVMIGAVVTAVVNVLVAAADPARLATYVAWGFGSFRGVTWPQVAVLGPVVLVGLAAAGATVKQLDALALGDRYAASMGVSIRRARLAVMATAALLAGSVTAFCGPIGFLGIATPHLVRAVFRTGDHRTVLPAVVLAGATLAVLADVAAQAPGTAGTLPLNSVTALFGVPVVGVIIARSRRRGLP